MRIDSAVCFKEAPGGMEYIFCCVLSNWQWEGGCGLRVPSHISYLLIHEFGRFAPSAGNLCNRQVLHEPLRYYYF